MANKAYKFRLYPNDKQIVLFAKTFGCVRFVYNHMLAEKIEAYNKEKKNIQVTPAKYKHEFEWLKEVDSLALANAQLYLQSAFTNFFRNPSKVGFPKYKAKYKGKNAYTTNCVNGNIRIDTVEAFYIYLKWEM